MDLEGEAEGLGIFNMWVTQLDQQGHIIGKVDGREVEFLVETGATVSLLNFTLRGSQTTHRILIHGVTAQRKQNLSKPLLVTI